MEIKDIIKDNIVLVIPNNIKKKILLQLNDLDTIYDKKIMDLNELIKGLSFSYDEKSIHYLMKTYNMKYLVAKTYLDNIKYITDKDYKNKKINKLVSIKNELEQNNLLIYDDLFKNLITNKEIIIYGYNYIDKFTMSILNGLDNVKIVEKQKKEYIPVVYEFNKSSDEIEFIANEICKLIKSGISIDKIKISNVTDEYKNDISKIFSIYNLNITIDKGYLYSTKMCKRFLELLKNMDLSLAIKTLEKEYNLNDESNLNVYNLIIKILNKYYFCHDELLYDMLVSEFKNCKISRKKYKDEIEIIDIKDNVIEDDEYVFLMNFNQTVMPKIYKDENYISDKEKELLNLEKSYEKNSIEKNVIIDSIKNIKNLVITYKKKISNEKCYPSNIIEDLNLKVIKKDYEPSHYSNLINKINLTRRLDNLVKYSFKDEKIDLLYSNYNDIDFMTFDNKFKGINSNELLKYIDNNICLSYSSMNDYYKCSFKYYLSHILKLNKYEETFATYIGKLFHYILSICFLDNFDFNEEYDKYILNHEFTYKEKFYITNLKEDLKFIIDTIKKQYTHCSFNDAFYEEEVCVENDNINIKFKGIIDKMLYKKEKNKTYVVIIDYKTGNPELDLNSTIYGLNLQLPVYLYLVKNTNKIENAEILGFYLQKLLPNKFSKEKNKTYKNLKENDLKLQGYTISDEKLINLVDDTYENSEVIKGLKMTKNGFYSYSKVITKDKIDKLINLTEEKIKEASDNILSGNFDINPKKIKNENVSCKFCEYKDICYMTEKDVVTLKEHKDLDFL